MRPCVKEARTGGQPDEEAVAGGLRGDAVRDVGGQVQRGRQLGCSGPGTPAAAMRPGWAPPRPPWGSCQSSGLPRARMVLQGEAARHAAPQHCRK